MVLFAVLARELPPPKSRPRCPSSSADFRSVGIAVSQRSVCTSLVSRRLQCTDLGKVVEIAPASPRRIASSRARLRDRAWRSRSIITAPPRENPLRPRQLPRIRMTLQQSTWVDRIMIATSWASAARLFKTLYTDVSLLQRPLTDLRGEGKGVPRRKFRESMTASFITLGCQKFVRTLPFAPREIRTGALLRGCSITTACFAVAISVRLYGSHTRAGASHVHQATDTTVNNASSESVE